MKLEVLKENLEKAIFKSEKVAGKNLTLPVLNCLLLEAKNDELVIRATNLDLGIEIKIPAKIELEGITAVNASVLNNYISNISKSKNISLNLENNNLIIKSENNSTTIKSIPNEDFPIIPRIESKNSFKIDPKLFINGLKSVYFSSSNSTIKPELASVMVEYKNGFIYFTATDSFRLAEKKVDDSKIKEGFEQILLPIKNISEIIRVLEDINTEVYIEVDKNQISFESKGIYLNSRVIDGVFPDYEQLIPKEFKTEIVVLKQDLLNSIRISTIFSDKFNQIRFKVKPGGKLFEIETNNIDVGESKTRIDSVLEGSDVEINFNHRYITDCFQSITSDSVGLYLNEIGKPMVIKGIGDNQFTYLVMPMNK